MAEEDSSSRVFVKVNELLCFVQHGAPNVPKLNLVNVGSTFYTADEIVLQIVAAKIVLYEYARLCVMSCRGAPLFIGARVIGNEKKPDFDDIRNLWMHLDVNKIQLPVSAAANLKRVPSVNPSLAEICAPATNVSNLQQEVEVLVNLKASVIAA